MGHRIPKYIHPFIAALHFVVTRLPHKMAHHLMGFVLGKGGRIFLKTKNIRTNIREIFPDMEQPAVEALKDKILVNFGYHIAEMFHIASFRDGKHGVHIDYSTPDGVVFDGKGPAIYIGIHAGSWELCPLIFAQKNQPFMTIYTKNEHAIIDDLLMGQRRQTGAKYIEKSSALKPCFKALKNEEAIGLLIDQRVDSGTDVDFFGRPTSITRMPAMLAMKFNCPIIPFDVVRIKPGHLRVVIKDAIIPSGEKDQDAELKLTQEIAEAVQAAITRNIESWLCTKRRWRSVDKEKFKVQKLVSNGLSQTSPTSSPVDQ